MKGSRFVLLVVLLAFGAAAVAQVAVTNSGYVSLAGPAVPPVSASSPMLATPQMTFVNVSKAPVGATNATGNNLAGARNATITNVAGISEASTTLPVIVNAENAPTPEAQPAAVETEPSETAELRPSGFLDVGPVAEGIPSVAEMAREARQRESRPGNVRTYTNADVERLTR